MEILITMGELIFYHCQKKKERTEPLINNGGNIFNFSGYEYSKEIHYLSSDIEVVDFNKDGYLDIAV